MRVAPAHVQPSPPPDRRIGFARASKRQHGPRLGSTASTRRSGTVASRPGLSFWDTTSNGR